MKKFTSTFEEKLSKSQVKQAAISKLLQNLVTGSTITVQQIRLVGGGNRKKFKVTGTVIYKDPIKFIIQTDKGHNETFTRNDLMSQYVRIA
jgi:hypothetical protein